jgi:predicted amidophosphoribosyltransferase
MIQIPFLCHSSTTNPSCTPLPSKDFKRSSSINSFQQAHNLDGVFKINLDHNEYSPCLLIDDMVDSRWTFTVASALLRETGCTAVYPLALDFKRSSSIPELAAAKFNLSH